MIINITSYHQNRPVYSSGYTSEGQIGYNISTVTCCNPCSHFYKHDGFDKKACGVWDGFIIGLPVTRLPCRAPSSVWRINLLSFFPATALHTSCLRISYSSPNSVSCRREWLCNLMKWEKGGKKERKRKASCTSYISGSALMKTQLILCCGWVQHGGSGSRFTQIHPLTPWRWPCRTQHSSVGCWEITLWRGCGVSA